MSSDPFFADDEHYSEWRTPGSLMCLVTLIGVACVMGGVAGGIAYGLVNAGTWIILRIFT